jgi:hypothetical protein
VPLGQQHRQGQPDRAGLAVDDRLDGLARQVRRLGLFGERALGPSAGIFLAFSGTG